MKKVILAIVLVMFAGTAFAAIPDLEGFKHSKNVAGDYSAAATGGGGNDVYVVATKHNLGNKVYHTGSTTTYMFQESVDQTASITLATDPSTISDTSMFSGYQQM